MMESACNQLFGKSTQSLWGHEFLLYVSSALAGYLLALWLGIEYLMHLKWPSFPFLYFFNVLLSAFLLSQYREINLGCWIDWLHLIKNYFSCANCVLKKTEID